MWGCCLIHVVSYGKPNQLYPERLSDRVKLEIDYAKLLNRMYRNTGRHLSVLAPRAWPDLSFVSDDERNRVLDAHPSAPPLKFISEVDVKLAQRLLHNTPSDLWLSEEDKGLVRSSPHHNPRKDYQELAWSATRKACSQEGKEAR